MSDVTWDTPETVASEALRPTVAAFVDILRREDGAAAVALGPVAPPARR